MSQNETMYISEEATCPMASCSRSNTCARHAGYQKALAEKATFSVLNPQLLKLDGNNFPYHLVAEKQLWARGFKRMYDTMPSGNTHYFSHCTPYAERQYYKAKKGEILIDPEMQKELLAIFERNGANTSIGFDSYEERVVLVEK